ncbi:MAG: geranylgeranyl reductase family protein [Dehalococcoidia bacterium]|nr:geranylgeranyl reductase family protein [Dehalococcoidia bacterium]
MTRYDVAIVGAGPAGSTAAYHLSQAGAKVLLIDRAKFPRDKPCGGGVTARAYDEAPVDLTPVVEQKIRRVRFSFRLGDFFDYEYPRTLVYMTQRHRMDHFLAQQAEEAGATFQDGCVVRAVELEGKAARISFASGSAEAGVLIGADGSNGAVARAAGLTPVIDPPVALEANFPYAGKRVPMDWSGMLALELGSMYGGYGWSFPKADHFNVGCGGWREEGGRLREHLASLRSHYGLDAAPMEHIRGHHLPTRSPGKAIVKGRALLVGDAAGLVDPMSGEGIHAAFVSGRLASEAVQRYLAGKAPDLWSYEAAVERELMPDIGWASLLRDAFHFTPRPCYEVMRRSGAIKKSLCQLITGERDYASFLRQFGPLLLVLRFWAARGRAARRSAA